MFICLNDVNSSWQVVVPSFAFNSNALVSVLLVDQQVVSRHAALQTSHGRDNIHHDHFNNVFDEKMFFNQRIYIVVDCCYPFLHRPKKKLFFGVFFFHERMRIKKLSQMESDRKSWKRWYYVSLLCACFAIPFMYHCYRPFERTKICLTNSQQKRADWERFVLASELALLKLTI